jgi:hypothetical protein
LNRLPNWPPLLPISSVGTTAESANLILNGNLISWLGKGLKVYDGPIRSAQFCTDFL